MAYDFGIMGRIDDYTRRVYAEILIGFIRRDYRRVAEVHFEAGYVPRRPRRGRLRPGAARGRASRSSAWTPRRISMARLLAYLFEVTERFGMQTRTELILLQRTMVVVEGVARSLDPAHEHLGGGAPGGHEYIRDPRAAGRGARPRGDGARSWRGSGRSCRRWRRRR